MSACSRLFPFLLALPLLGNAGLSQAAGDAGACRYVPVAKLPVHFDHSPLPLVEGSINGKPATLMLDTGAGDTYLTRSAIERLDIPIRASGRFAHGVGGSSEIYTAKLNDFSFGAVHSGRIVLPVLGNSGAPFRFDVIIGDDPMLHMDMEIALAEKFVQFFHASDCGDTYLAYWDKDAMEIAFGGTEKDNRPRFIVELNGQKLEAMIDTGSGRTGVHRATAERLGVKLDSAEAPKAGNVVGVGDKKVARWVANFDTFTIGTETIKNARLDIIDNAPQGDLGAPDIILGDDFLRAHRVLIATSQRRLYVSYLGGEVFSK
jgi:hypothetical protein